MQILLDFPCCFFLDSHFGLYRHGKHAKSEQLTNTMKITIQLRPATFQGQGAYIGRRSFSERVLPQEFTSDIYTTGGTMYNDEVGIFSRSQPHLGGFAKTELGMKRAINKLIREV